MKVEDGMKEEDVRKEEQRENKAGYTAQDAPSKRLKITGDGRTDGGTDGRTDTLSYRDATAHLKKVKKKRRKKKWKRIIVFSLISALPRKSSPLFFMILYHEH